jgi:hypothetical protein
VVLGFLASCSYFRDCSPRSDYFRRVDGLRDRIPSFPSVKGLMRYPHQLLASPFVSTAESALAGIAAPVLVGSAPELSRKRTERRRCAL